MYRRVIFALALGAGANGMGGPAQAQARSGASQQASRALNPAIGVNGLLLAHWGTEEHEEPPGEASPEPEHVHEVQLEGAGAQLQAVELKISASVDAYAKADLIIGMHGETVEIEEAFVSLLDPPASLGVRFGLFRLPLGKSSPLHAHQQPFVERSLAVSELVGSEGLADVGVELSWLTPLPWFSELTVTVTDGGAKPFGSTRRRDLAYGARWRNLWDMAETTTLDIGLSGVHGWSEAGDPTTLGAVDLSLRWRPLSQGRERSFLWRNELLVRRGVGEPVAGAYSLASWQLSRRWFVQGRYDHLGFGAHGHEEEEHNDGEDDGTTEQLPATADLEERWRASLLLAYVPSEFQSLRLQASHTQSVAHADESEARVMLQYIFSLGPHPAHLYW